MGFEQYNDRAFITIHSDGPRGPKGDKGDPGEKGDKGEKGDTGEVTQEEFDQQKDAINLKVAKVEDDLVAHKEDYAKLVEKSFTGWVLGGYSATGETTTDNSFLRNNEYIYCDIGDSFNFSFDGYTMFIYRYDINKTYIEQFGWKNSYTVTTEGFYRISIYKTSGTVEGLDLEPIGINLIAKKYSQGFIKNAHILDSQISYSQLRKDAREIMTPSNVLMSEVKPKMIAHMGGSLLAPENSIPAYVLAGKNGFWGAEVDVQETVDGYLVCMHDETVDRTTNGTGLVSDLTLAQIKSFDIDVGTNINLYPNLKVPTFSEYISTCKKYGMKLIIEFKSDYNNMPKVIEEIKKYRMLHNAILLLGWKDYPERVRKYDMEIPLQYITSKTTEAEIKTDIDYISTIYNHCGIDIMYNYLTEDIVRYAFEKNVPVATYTLNDDLVATELINTGIDMITTDKVLNIT